MAKRKRSPHTQLALRWLRDDGWEAVQVVEHYVPGAGVRRDLFGIADVLAIGARGTLAVQVTSRSNVASRVTKVTESEHLPAVRAAGWGVVVWGFDKADNGRWVLARSVTIVPLALPPSETRFGDGEDSNESGPRSGGEG